MIDRRSVRVAVLALGIVGVATAGRSPPRPAPRAGPAPPPHAAPLVVTAPSRPPARAPARAPGPGAVSATFAAAYAAFVYGRLSAAQLPGASPYVRRQAAGLRPAAPAVVLAAADPRVRSVRLVGGPQSAAATAFVAIVDGAFVYDVVLDLRRRPAGWTITGLRETG